MGRNRVLSFMSTWSATHRDSTAPAPAPTPTPTSSTPNSALVQTPISDPKGNFVQSPTVFSRPDVSDFSVPASPVRSEYAPSPVSITDSPSASPAGRQRSNSRLSMVQPYQPKMMNMNEETIPELQPIFGFLNNHANKLYQEGYFLKLDDQDSKGKPNPDRTWTECFAQLVGTVLSLWDAAELDAAGDDGEVLPKFLNLTDASIKMIESLPTKSNDENPLQNILSISTAGRNRYLLHFNSHHSLLQWTAGIKLAVYEHTTLQEAYTGALIAGKGKLLNNIGVIMERSRFKVEEWVRVRFGAGVPWRRCWCVITPPDEKEYLKMQKEFKKRSPYDRSHPPILKGDIKFYDSKKDAEKKKKARPIASITDAYAAYAIYPQSRSLIDNSTLLKVEGNITIHSDPPSSTEGFVFIMPETHPAVNGFEMLLRFLFPTWDTFGLYGRPGRLVASVLDVRSLMFAMPKHKKYGYLEILDVTGIITAEESTGWSDREWRKKLKELTASRISVMDDGSRNHSRSNSRSGSQSSNSRSSKRLSFSSRGNTPTRPRVNFADDSDSSRASRSMSLSRRGPRTDSAPPDTNRQRRSPPLPEHARHSRNVSDTQLPDAPFQAQIFDESPVGTGVPMRAGDRARTFATDLASTPERVSSEDERTAGNPSVLPLQDGIRRMETPEPVVPPPSFAHAAGARPQQKPYHSPELRRANSRLSSATLSQLANASGLTPEHFGENPMEHYHVEDSPTSGRPALPGQAVQQPQSATPMGMNANLTGYNEALTHNPNLPHSYQGLPPPPGPSQQRSKSPLSGPPGPPPNGPLPALRSGAPTSGAYPGAAPQQLTSQDRGSPLASEVYPPQRDHRMGPPPPAHGSSMDQSYPLRQVPSNGPPPGGRRTPPPGSGAHRGPPAYYQGGGSPPINRKPLPQRTTSLQRSDDGGSAPQSPTNSSGSFTQRVMDEATRAANRVSQAPDPMPRQPYGQGQVMYRKDSQASSRYDDASSTASPDYASTRRSTDTQGSVDRPRAGVLRTTGNEAAQESNVQKSATSEYAIPDIDFGRTINYSRVKPQGGPAISPSADSDTSFQLGGRPHVPASHAPVNHAPINHAPTHYRQESDDTARRSVAWQPGLAVTTPTNERALTPEQFVQQRAAAVPMYAHQRNPSTNTLTGLRKGTPTPPLGRPGSQQAFHSRNNSSDLLQSGRPISQGTGMVLSSGEVSSHLSAREQEHVARMTGTPLIAVAGSRGGAQSGLVGAIDARERERAQMKQGFAGQAVAQAIDQRQREQHQQAQRAAQAAYAQQQAQLAAQQQGYMTQGMMGPGQVPSMYAGNMGMSHGPGTMHASRSHSPGPGMMHAPRSHSPGPGMVGSSRSHSPGPGFMAPGMGPPRMNSNFQPISGQQMGGQQMGGQQMGGQQMGGQQMGGQQMGGQQMGGQYMTGYPRANHQGYAPGPQTMQSPAAQGYGAHPGAQAYAQGGGWANPNMRQQQPGAHQPAQGQYGNSGSPNTSRPGTAGRVPFQGHAF